MKFLFALTLVLAASIGWSSAYVVGGTATTIGAHPHQLSLRVSGSHSCGASLISNTKTVTAAHCVGSSISVYSLLGGSTERSVTNCATCHLFSATSITRHPDYSASSLRGYPNDVAVIKHSSQAYNSNFKNIEIASSGTFAGQSCQITGWGKTCGSCGLPNTLQQATMTVMTNSACASYWGSNQINDGHVCVESRTASACNGDSGGPLVCQNLLVGATSWGANGCPTGSPSVYTRLSYFKSWINAQ